jgi:hypothetical protein
LVKISNPLLLFLLGLFVATLSDNFDSVLRNRKFATFEKSPPSGFVSTSRRSISSSHSFMAVAAGTGRHVPLNIYARLSGQPAMSAGPIIFGAMIRALAHYWLTD